MFNSKQTTFILLAVSIVSLIVNGCLCLYIVHNSQNLSWKKAEVAARQNDIDGYRKSIANLESQNQRLANRNNELDNQIKSQPKEIKWLKYDNKDFGISFEYPNSWGEILKISTNTVEVDANNEYLKRCIGNNPINKFSQNDVVISFDKLNFDVLKYSTTAPLRLVDDEDCGVLNLLDRRIKVKNESNILVDGFKGYVSSGIAPDGGLVKTLEVFTNNLYVQSRVGFGYYEDWGKFAQQRQDSSGIIEKIIASNPSGSEEIKLSDNLKFFDKFIASIKFIK